MAPTLIPSRKNLALKQTTFERTILFSRIAFHRNEPFSIAMLESSLFKRNCSLTYKCDMFLSFYMTISQCWKDKVDLVSYMAKVKDKMYFISAEGTSVWKTKWSAREHFCIAKIFEDMTYRRRMALLTLCCLVYFQNFYFQKIMIYSVLEIRQKTRWTFLTGGWL